MTNKILLFVLLIFLINTSVKSQDCFKYFPQKEGTSQERKEYDKKDKLTGTTVQTVMKKSVTDSTQQIDIKIESDSPDSDSTYTSKYSIICENGKMYIDMTSYLSDETLAPYEGLDMEIDADKIDFPSNPKVGQELTNGSVKATVKNEGMTMLTLNITITNRKVAAIEKITTEAGTFDCVKITYDAATTIGIFTVKTQSAEWFSEGVGLVRNETYNKKGKLSSYSVLTKITK